MSFTRILQTTQVVLTKVLEVDGVPTDASGGVTATAKRLDGTAVHSASAGHPATGTYTYTLPGQANLDLLTVDWTGTLAGAAVSLRDYVEIVGGFLFGLAEARAAHAGLASTATYPWELLAAKRIEVEQRIEGICEQAFVPRFARHYLSGTGAARLPIPQDRPHRMIRAVRAVTVDGTVWSAGDVDDVSWSDDGVFYRAGGGIWPAGHRNVIVEWEHGHDSPPEDIRAAGILLLRSVIAATTSGVPDRAISWTAQDGGTYRISTPARKRTGIPNVDGPLEAYTRPRRAAFA